MSNLRDIPIQVEVPEMAPHRTANLLPVLLELQQALQDLHSHGRRTQIDLAAMPFSGQDETDLRAVLGRGEVSASVNAFGPTLVEETAVPGIWIVEHRDVDDRRLTISLEVAAVPEILVTPAGDIADGVRAIREVTAAMVDAAGGADQPG